MQNELTILNDMACINLWEAAKWRKFIIKELEINGIDYLGRDPINDFIFINRTLTCTCKGHADRVRMYLYILELTRNLAPGQKLHDMFFLIQGLRAYVPARERRAQVQHDDTIVHLSRKTKQWLESKKAQS